VRKKNRRQPLWCYNQLHEVAEFPQPEPGKEELMSAEMTQAELAKINAEIAKLIAETSKLNRESA